MKKLFKTLTILLACLLYAGSSSGQTWTIYDGNAKITSTNSTGITWVDGNKGGTLPTQWTTQTQTSYGTNKWDATKANRSSLNTPNLTSNTSLDDTVTLMFRVKNTSASGTSKLEQGFQLEMYSYNIANNAKYKTCFYQGGNDSIYFDNATTATADKRFYYPTLNQKSWHTYRITTCNGTSSGSVITVYIDENTTPVATYTSKITTTNLLFIKTGCPNASWINTMNAEIDWISWDTTGAYIPGTGTLPTNSFVDGVSDATAKAITSFSFTNPAATGIITEGAKTIAISVPKYTDISALTPTIISSLGSSVTPAGAVNFVTSGDSTAIFTVTAADNTTQIYTVKVNVAKQNHLNAITAFGITNQQGLTTIDAVNHTITVTMPYGTNRTALQPTVNVSQDATVSPLSGTATDFSAGTVNYTVTAENGTPQVWAVTVTNALNTANDIVTFDFNGLTPAVVGVTNTTAKTVRLTVPFGTVLTALVPTITVSPNATISPLTGIAQDFTNNVVYTVTAGDGSTIQAWNVIVDVTPAATDATLQDLKVNGTTIPAFNSATTSYIFRVESGTTIVPTVTATKNNQFASEPVVTPATKILDTTKVVVTAQDGSTKTYSVIFKFFEEWVKYDCSVRLDSVPGNSWVHATSAGNLATISVVDDPDITGNKLMSFESTDLDKPTLTINPWAQLKDSAKLTFIIRMKAKSTTVDRVSDIDVHYAKKYRDKFFPQRPTAANTDPISIKAEKRPFVDPVSDIDNWHIYRLVVDTALGCQLYMDEKLDTLCGGMVKKGTDVAPAYKISIGDGGGFSYSCYFDYIIWTKGAYKPGTGPAIPEEFSTAYWSDSYLSNLKVNGTSITGFNKDSLNYKLVLTSKTVPTVTATAHNGKATVVITPAAQVPGTTKVEVTAQDGTTKATYNVNFEFEDATNPSLIGLKYGTTDVPGFNTDSLKYKVTLPAGTTALPVIAGTKAWSGATAVYTQATALPGKATVVVTSADGSATKTYEVNFVVAKYTDASLSKIKSGIYEIASFKADTLKYKVILNAGTTTVPAVVATPKIAKSKVYVTLAATLKDTTKILVKAEDTTYTRTYKITYEVLKSKIATVDSIKLGDSSIPNFDPAVLTYNIDLPIGTKVAPTFKVETTSDSAKLIITNATTLPGKATLMVISEDLSDTITYEINFTVLKSSDATLSGIKYGTTSVANFATATMAYNITLTAGTTEVPAVTATPTYADAVVIVTAATALPGKTTIKVTSEDGLVEKTYELNFRVSTVGVESASGNVASFYPNPAIDVLHIQLKKSATTNISLVNMLGVQVMNKTISGDKLTLNVSNLSRGMYFLKITSEGTTSTQKVEILK